MPNGIKHERKKNKLWSTSQMAGAISAVRGNVMGYKKAAKEFQVPKASLFRLVKLNEPDAEVAASTSVGRKPVFSKSMEQDLVKYLIERETCYKALTKKVICTLAFQFAVQNNVAHRFGENNMAGTHWYKNFMKRNRDKLCTRKPTGT